MPFILRNVRLQGVDSVMTPPRVALRPGNVWCAICRNPSMRERHGNYPRRGPEFADKIMNNQIQGGAGENRLICNFS
jgi:acrylyl-CoA reductase (NADPH)